MNLHERRVLLRKRAIIADTLNFSPRAQKIYRRHGLLNDVMTGKIMVEPTDFGRMLKFLELLGQKIGRYCEAISQILVDQGHAWLADEIHADVLAERGRLAIDEYVAREAGVFVGQHLGLPTMLSDMDKKRIQYLIALRFQTAKEAYRLGQERHLAELEHREESEHALRDRIDELLTTITVFLKVKAPEDPVNNRLLTMTPSCDNIRRASFSSHDTTSGRVDGSVSSQDGRQLSSIRCLQSAVEDLLGIISTTSAEKESLVTERKRVCHLLNIDNPVASMDVVVKDAVDKASEDLATNVRELALHDKMARSLESRVKSVKGNAERHVAVLQKQVVFLESSADKKGAIIEELNRELRDVRGKKEVALDELGKWRSRCQLLEGTRHLGYYHPGWFDDLYDADDQLDPDERPADIPSRLTTPLGTPRADETVVEAKRNRVRLKRNVIPRKVLAPTKGPTH
ncbi:hypothetical protein NP493_695g01047 [Ridgeia piscesae]|uniref:Uncharacterized protein n=1 Tax=Ridgeia piscesae TaxID=27915 RepID=A0AAD9NPK3_RIDPI|nr:hypothetical protein NP493_695g01047 [Ridgeia piscesae]